MKKVLMLGGSTSQVCAIKKAKEMGLYVIICDYLPDNPGQYWADEYYPTSTTDKEAVLELAKTLDLDAAICYASDPAAPTAAYVCEALGLPTNPYESVMVLSNKDTFREYLKEHGFNVPETYCFSDYEEFISKKDEFNYPVMVKPVDSCGSKGINKIYSADELDFAYNDAMQYSRCKRIVVEKFIQKKGYQISGDGFSVDGKLVFRCFGNEYYSDNGIKEYVPLGECWPSVLDEETQNRVHDELQRLITCLGMKTGAYNIEVIIDENDDIYILELGARNGGSLIPQITQYATGVDMVEYTIKAALGEDCSDLKMAPAKGFWCNYMVHTKVTGKFKEVHIADELKDNFVEFQTDFKEGDEVFAFENSGHAIGTMVFKFDSQKEMFDKIANITNYIQVEVK
jgi:biotin carboxylase